MNYIKSIVIFVLLIGTQGFAQENPSKEERLGAWFNDAKLGIFMHWGYYGVNGIGESWSLYHKQIGYDDYMAQSKKFTAENYDPQAWADLFKRIGARYAVLTTKHHDGVALWDTKVSKLNVVEKTPAKRDLVAPLVDALRKDSLKVGLYFSLIDWSHPDYDVVFPRPDTRKNYPQKKQDQLSPWQRFLKFNHDQLKELDTKFHPDLWWFDGDWEQSSEAWQAASLKDTLLKWNAGVVVNSRLKSYGDYSTPEQGVPVVRPDGSWEFCMTMNDNWGNFPSDTNYKPVSQIIRTFVEVISSGGNLLLNIGPKPDGTIGAPEMERLEALGEWVNKHEAVIFNSKAGLPYGHFYGPSMLSKDETKIYLALFDTPNNYISLKGIQNKVKSIKVVGNGQDLSFERNGGAEWNNIPGILRIEAPKTENLDPNVTLLEVDLEGSLKLYRGHGQAVEMN